MANKKTTGIENKVKGDIQPKSLDLRNFQYHHKIRSPQSISWHNLAANVRYEMDSRVIPCSDGYRFAVLYRAINYCEIRINQDFITIGSDTKSAVDSYDKKIHLFIKRRIREKNDYVKNYK